MKNKSTAVVLYILVILSSMAAVYSLVHLGATKFPIPAYNHLAQEAHTHSGSLRAMLTALLVVLLTAQVVGLLAVKLRQPRVIGEIVGGLLLGPSFLGAFFPELGQILLPDSVFPFLSVVAQIGVLFFMFTIGLELDLGVLKKAGHTALAVSHASIILPFILGVSLAFFIFENAAPLGIGFPSFALFIGVSMSVTAFPVLARILNDFQITRTPMGVLALSCAAIDDATAWCLLAVVVGILRASPQDAALTLVLTVTYIAAMLLIARPLINRYLPLLEKSSARISETSLALILIGLLISAVVTEAIGIHALFGAFFLGAVVPPHSRVAQELTGKLQDLVRVFFLPAFFAFTGLRTEIGLLSTKYDVVLCLVVIALATLGKFGGAFVAGKLSGMSTRDSSIIGTLMNTRGLVELIVLNVGLDLHVLSPRLFTILVLMAVITTMATGPGLLLLGVGRNRNSAA